MLSQMVWRRTNGFGVSDISCRRTVLRRPLSLKWSQVTPGLKLRMTRYKHVAGMIVNAIISSVQLLRQKVFHRITGPVMELDHRCHAWLARVRVACGPCVLVLDFDLAAVGILAGPGEAKFRRGGADLVGATSPRVGSADHAHRDSATATASIVGAHESTRCKRGVCTPKKPDLARIHARTHRVRAFLCSVSIVCTCVH
jgi:hypothetical protein